VKNTIASRGVFVGRHEELEAVSSALEAVRESQPRILVIEGEPGIGKTAFVRESLARARDVVVLEASGDESETSLEYGVVSQLVARAPRDSSWESLSARLSTGSPMSAFAVGAELLALVGSLQDRAPVVLVVDDAHWVDQASAGALLFALRRLFADRVLVLIVSRPGALDQGGMSWSRLLSDPERVQRLTLSGLTGREIGQLANSLGLQPLTVAGAERLREHTGGNPLYVRGLLSELSPAALALEREPLPAPHSFAATVLARLTGVSVEAQEFVAAAAVAGTRCPATLAGAVAGLDDHSTALEEALVAELLTPVPTAIPEQVAFPHPLVRAAVYDDLSPRRRRTLHLACANLTSGSAALAHRVAASQEADDDLVAELETTAEADIAAGRLTLAVQYLLWAARVASAQERRETALSRAVECLINAGAIPQALGMSDEVLACSDSARRSFVIAPLTAVAGRLREAEGLLRDVMARPDFTAHPELEGPVTATLAITCALLGNGVEAITWSERALEAEQLPAVNESAAKQALGMGLMRAGRPVEAVAVFDLVSASRIDPQPFEAELLTARGNLKGWWGDLREAVDDLSAVIRWSRSGMPLRNLPNAYAALAAAEYRLGRWEDGLTHAEVAVSLAEDLDRVWDLAFVHAAASYFHAGQGNWDIAAEHVSAARRAAETVWLPANLYYSCVAAANLASMRADWDSVWESLGPLQPRSASAVGSAWGQPFRWLLEAEALLFTSQLEPAADVLDRLEAALAESPQAVAYVELCRLRGALEQAREHQAAARTAFARGQEAAKSAGSPLSEGTLALAHGHFLRKSGSRRAAIARLQVARGLFERLGGRPLVERCDAELAACGVRAQSQGVNGDDYGLTAREQVVAALVASGKSNREVAAELYLSTKAVEYHLANIFAKLAIRSRHQLASRLGGVMVKAGD
jgi:DNA-binding NarL/FixJ family response regulator/tetratricopeptide (TPR) repeat protein